MATSVIISSPRWSSAHSRTKWKASQEQTRVPPSLAEDLRPMSLEIRHNGLHIRLEVRRGKAAY